MSLESGTESLPYEHYYKTWVSLSFVGKRLIEINPAKDSRYSQQEWDRLGRKGQEDWLNEWLRKEGEEWAKSFVSYGWDK